MAAAPDGTAVVVTPIASVPRAPDPGADSATEMSSWQASRMLTANTSAIVAAWAMGDRLPTHTETSWGSTDTVVNEDTVFASILASSLTATTATLLARHRAARRNASS